MSEALTPQTKWVTPSDWEKANERKLLYCTLLLVLVGVLWRFVRYLLCYPVWGDEAMLALNLLDADYISLTKQLDNCQIAPLLFLWGELTSLRLFGSSEYAMRLLPFLAGLGSLALFARLAWLTLTPYARLIAVGFLSVAIWPVSMGTNIKPYAFDLFMALALMVPTVEWLQRPERLRWLVVLIAVAPIALMSSYPAVFIAGGVSLALLAPVWKARDWKTVSLFVVYNLLMIGTFVGHYLLVGRNQLSSPVSGVTTAVGMHRYWEHTFPPYDVLGFLKWFVLIHTGQMMAFPIGDSNGGGIVTFSLFVAGIVALWILGRRELLVLCLSPFVLGLIAALLRKYPYGASCRLSQFLAPSIVLLAGAGGSYLLHLWWERPTIRLRLAYAWVVLLFCIGVGGMFWHIVQPYRQAKDEWIRQMVDVCFLEKPADAPIVVLQPLAGTDPVLAWYLRRKTDKLIWFDPQHDALDQSSDAVWCVRMDIGEPAQFLPLVFPASLQRTWILRDKASFEHPREREPNAIFRCHVSSWFRNRQVTAKSSASPSSK